MLEFDLVEEIKTWSAYLVSMTKRFVDSELCRSRVCEKLDRSDMICNMLNLPGPLRSSAGGSSLRGNRRLARLRTPHTSSALPGPSCSLLDTRHQQLQTVFICKLHIQLLYAATLYTIYIQRLYAAIMQTFHVQLPCTTFMCLRRAYHTRNESLVTTLQQLFFNMIQTLHIFSQKLQCACTLKRTVQVIAPYASMYFETGTSRVTS